MRSRSCLLRNCTTMSSPNVKETPRSFSPHPMISRSGSDHSRSHNRPGTNHHHHQFTFPEGRAASEGKLLRVVGRGLFYDLALLQKHGFEHTSHQTESLMSPRDTPCSQNATFDAINYATAYQDASLHIPLQSNEQQIHAYISTQARLLFFPVPTTYISCLLYTSPSPRDQRGSRMPSSA